MIPFTLNYWLLLGAGTGPQKIYGWCRLENCSYAVWEPILVCPTQLTQPCCFHEFGHGESREQPATAKTTKLPDFKFLWKEQTAELKVSQDSQLLKDSILDTTGQRSKHTLMSVTWTHQVAFDENRISISFDVPTLFQKFYQTNTQTLHQKQTHQLKKNYLRNLQGGPQKPVISRVCTSYIWLHF